MHHKLAVIRIACSILIGLSATSCNPKVTVGLDSPTRDVIQNAIDTLTLAPGQWEQVLSDLIGQVSDETKEIISTLKDEMTDFTREVIEDAGIETRCNVDFVGQRVANALQQILDNDGPNYALAPWICHLRPEEFTIDQAGYSAEPTLKVTGFGFTTANVSSGAKIYVVDENGQTLQQLDTTANFVSAYRMTLNIQGIQFPNSPRNKLRVIWATENYYTEASILVAPVAQASSYTFTPLASEKFCPDRVGGDKEFGGHGPNVSASAGLFVKNENELWVRISLHAIETTSDWSEASGTWEYPLWSAPLGSTITEYSPAAASTADYTDDNHQLDRPTINGSGLVQKFEILGDTEDDDIGNCTDDDVFIQVFFGEIQVKYIEN